MIFLSHLIFNAEFRWKNKRLQKGRRENARAHQDAFSGDVTDDVLPTRLTPNKQLQFLISL